MTLSAMGAASRLDAEYAAHPNAEYLDTLSLRSDTKLLDELVNHISSGHTPYRHDVKTGDVNFVTVECISPLQFNNEKLKKITYHQYIMEFSHQKITEGSVLCTIKRRICQAYPWLDKPDMLISINQDVALIKPREDISAAYLAAYLSSGIGQGFADRQKTEQMNPYISLVNLRSMPVVVAPLAFQAAVENTIRLARTRFDQAAHSVENAEKTLLAALGLADWTPPELLSYTARAGDAFAAGRLDAQYFMPAKEQVKRSLAALPGRVLGDRADSIRHMFVPDRAPPDMRVRNYDVTDALVPLLDAEKEPQAAAEIGSVKKALRDGDVAVSRLRAYLREIAVVRTDDDIPSVGSSEFIVLRPKKDQRDLSPETLMVFLRSAPVQTILKWCQDGSQHPRFSEGDLLSTPVPDAVASVSGQITGIVQEGFAARRRARTLLEAAKRAVEIAIEEGEPAALSFLDAAEGAH